MSLTSVCKVQRGRPITHPPNHACSLALSLTHSLIHSLTHSLTYSLSHSLTHSLTSSPSLIHSFNHSLAHQLTCSLILSPITLIHPNLFTQNVRCLYPLGTLLNPILYHWCESDRKRCYGRSKRGKCFLQDGLYNYMYT
jgi:hypothetical protein